MTFSSTMNISKQLAELGSTLLKTTEARTCARQQHGLSQKSWFKVLYLLSPLHPSNNSL